MNNMAYNQRNSKHMTEHPFHPKGGEPARPMSMYKKMEVKGSKHKALKEAATGKMTAKVDAPKGKDIKR